MLKTTKYDLGDQMLPTIIPADDPNFKEKLAGWSRIAPIAVIDKIELQVAELIKAKNASKTLNENELEREVDAFFRKCPRETYGNWVYYPWKNVVVRLLEEDDFIAVRTQRNNYKITPEEQLVLRTKKIGIIGLSVGQSVALVLALERSCGEMRLADFDTLELSNLNRIKAGIPDLGVAKTAIAAREISEIDPYIKLILYNEGVTEDNVDDFLTDGGNLDLLVDECDSLDIKILARERARHFGIPVLMETSDRGMVDIERFDLDPNRDILHGFLRGVSRESLKGLTTAQKVGVGLKITGLDTLSPRMKASLLEIGESISTWPQLASAVFLGGASIAHIGRRLLLGEAVRSGRYYVDLDKVIDLDQEVEFTPALAPPVQSADKTKNLPKNVLPSSYFLTKDQLHALLEKANMAPSGGNVQPWIWIYDQKGILHLFHDQVRSHSMLDFLGTGSLIAFGAAIENLRLQAASMGLEIDLIEQIENFEEDCIASIRFLGCHSNPIAVPNHELAEGIAIRNANRKNTKKEVLPRQVIASYIEMAESEGLFLDIKVEERELNKLSKVVGQMDRLRLFHEQGLKDFIHEVRWTEEEAKETLDGIDIATLELSGTEKAAMGLLKDPRTIKLLKKFLMGYGLTKISHQTIITSSAVFLLRGKDFTPKTYLKAGKVMQQIWLKANLDGYSFQPVTSCLFIFHKVDRDEQHGFTESEAKSVKELKNSFNSIFEMNSEQEELFMFRVNEAGESTVRAYRIKVEDTLIVL